MVRIHGVEIGFTGTQTGQTDAQKESVGILLDNLAPSMVHHGDCIGADEELDALAHERGISVYIHPPENSSKRAFCESYAYIDDPLPYLERNQVIVNDTSLLIATPRTSEEEVRSGTWYTVRFAKAMGRLVYVVDPDGKINLF